MEDLSPEVQPLLQQQKVNFDTISSDYILVQIFCEEWGVRFLPLNHESFPQGIDLSQGISTDECQNRMNNGRARKDRKQLESDIVQGKINYAD
eukprot:Awhi_evm1s9288